MKTSSGTSKKKTIKKEAPKGAQTIGIDLGDLWSHYCVLDEAGNVAEEGRFRTTQAALQKHFGDIARARIAMEAGTHSIWISEQLRQYGHEVLVAHVSELRAISRSDRKCDRVDAEKLARYARLDPGLLRPICHRSVAMQESLTLVRARDVLVRTRTGLINAIRGLAKPCGYRLPKSATSCFSGRCLPFVPEGLLPALKPLFAQVQSIHEQIKAYDKLILKIAKEQYPETKALSQVNGVGTLTALTYVLTVADKHRFLHSRDVGCYLGLRPKRSQSGEHDPQLGITKAGNSYLRRLLTECANYIVGPFGQDSALQRWGRHLASRGGKNARARAITAVARKLAVLLHRLWVTQAEYIPFPERQHAA
jgi:transposase